MNHITTVTQDTEDKDVFHINCTCGEWVKYRFEIFTQVEAQRHQDYHTKNGHKQEVAV